MYFYDIYNYIIVCHLFFKNIFSIRNAPFTNDIVCYYWQKELRGVLKTTLQRKHLNGKSILRYLK